MRVHVVGNVALDETFHVAAMPAPGESVLARGIARDLGGKGANQAIVASRAGAEVRLVSAVGDDEVGRWIGREIAAEGLDRSGLQTCAAASDRSVVIVGDGADNVIVTTNEAIRSLAPAAVEMELACAEAGDILVLQGNTAQELTEAALLGARARGLRTALNPSPADPALSAFWPLLDLVVLNEAEARGLTGLRDAPSAARAIITAGAGEVVLTRGRDGALLLRGEVSCEVPATPAQAVDPTGAGDTFAGILLALLARGEAIDGRGLGAAAAAAAVSVSRPGTRASFPTRDEIRAILARHGFP